MVEPTLPGARELYLDLGRFYDANRLEKRREELRELTRRYQAAYREAYAFLAAAGALEAPETPLSPAEVYAASERCLSLLPAAAPEAGGTRSVFLDAFCCEGRVSLTEQLSAWRRLALQGGPDAVSRVLEAAAKVLAKNRFPVVLCPDPLQPALLRRLLIPTLQTVFSANEGEETVLTLPEPQTNAAAEAERARLLELAGAALREARRQHDALEEVYNPCVDFAGVYAEADRQIYTIL